MIFRTKVASTHGDHSIQVTDLASGKLVRTLTGHPRTPWSLAFHPSSSHILASGCLGGQVRIWDLYVCSQLFVFVNMLTNCQTFSKYFKHVSMSMLSLVCICLISLSGLIVTPCFLSLCRTKKQYYKL